LTTSTRPTQGAPGRNRGDRNHHARLRYLRAHDLDGAEHTYVGGGDGMTVDGEGRAVHGPTNFMRESNTQWLLKIADDAEREAERDPSEFRSAAAAKGARESALGRAAFYRRMAAWGIARRAIVRRIVGAPRSPLALTAARSVLRRATRRAPARNGRRAASAGAGSGDPSPSSDDPAPSSPRADGRLPRGGAP
jgi:hypothetical protein